MCSVGHAHAAAPLIDLGFEASLFLLVFSSMFLAHIAGAVTWYLLTALSDRFEGREQPGKLRRERSEDRASRLRRDPTGGDADE
jgi:hypothetical protein